MGSIPGLGTSPGGRNGNPLHYSFLENPMDRGAWRVSVPGVARVRHDLATKPPPPSVQFSSVAQLCPTLCDTMNRSIPDLSVHHQLLEFTQTHVHRVSVAIQPSHPQSSPSHPSPIPPSIRVFSNDSTLLMRWPKDWSFSFSISPSKEYPGLVSFTMDWLDLLAVQGTLKSLLQHHSSKASILWRSAFFTVQLPSIHDHWKNHSLD